MKSSAYVVISTETAPTKIYTLSLHDALPICEGTGMERDYDYTAAPHGADLLAPAAVGRSAGDRKSTRLNSSHGYISYAVFCLKKKKNWRNCPLLTRQMQQLLAYEIDK